MIGNVEIIHEGYADFENLKDYHKSYCVKYVIGRVQVIKVESACSLSLLFAHSDQLLLTYKNVILTVSTVCQASGNNV